MTKKKVIPCNSEPIIANKPSNSPPKNSFHINTDDSGKVKISNDVSIANEKFSAFVKNFTDEIIKMGLPQKNTNKIFDLSEKLVKESASLYVGSIDPKIYDSELKKAVFDSISTANERICNQIHEMSSQYKRNKQQSKNKIYVATEEKSIGNKWRSKYDSEKIIPAHDIVQPTFQFVSIIKTIQSLFLQPEFKKQYFDYNESQKHECVPGVFKDYCCGSLFTENGLHLHKNALHIQLSIDDVELCCALKTKAGLHKVTVIYFKILNLPHEFSSKLDQIFLLAIYVKPSI